MDIGAVSLFLWVFEIRESINIFFEKNLGSRIHLNFNVTNIKHNIFFSNLLFLKDNIFKKISDLYNILLSNIVILNRLKNLGSIGLWSIKNNGVTGVLLRSSGLPINFSVLRGNKYLTCKKIITSSLSDCFSRLLLRLEEIFFCCNHLNNILTKKKNYYKTMENIIVNFNNPYCWKNKLLSYFFESSKGIFSITKIKKDKISKLKLKFPGLQNLHSLTYNNSEVILSDLISIIASLDIIMGEIDK